MISLVDRVYQTTTTESNVALQQPERYLVIWHTSVDDAFCNKTHPLVIGSYNNSIGPVTLTDNLNIYAA